MEDEAGEGTHAPGRALRIGFDARYVNDRYHGIGRVAFELLRALVAAEPAWEFIVYVHPGEPNTRFALDELAASPNVSLRPVRLPLLVPTEQALWPLLLRQDRVDLFHSPYVIGPIAGPTPTIVTVHDLIFERFPSYTPRRLLRAAYRALAALAIRHASAVIAVSDATRRDLARWYGRAEAKTVVVHNGIDPGFRRVTDAARLDDVRRRYQLPERFILGVGAGRPHKNFTALVHAAQLLGPGDPRAIVLASAPDPRFPDLVGQAIQRLGVGERVRRIQGVREADLAALYSLAEIFVFPSFVEGFGLPMLEAMAVGCPVIAARSSSLPEVGDDAVLYVDPRRPAEIVARVRDLDADPALRAMLVERGLARVASFSWDEAARRTAALYRRVMRHRRGTHER